MTWHHVQVARADRNLRGSRFYLNVMTKEFIRDQAVQFVCVAGGDSRDAGG
ncbi:MAG: hypothetical protein ACR2N1_08340 [Rubripirellula sp.]